jgi:tetratricopeptide (TPR) repeat protein
MPLLLTQLRAKLGAFCVGVHSLAGVLSTGHAASTNAPADLKSGGSPPAFIRIQTNNASRTSETDSDQAAPPMPAELVGSGNVKFPNGPVAVDQQVKYLKGLLESARQLRKQHSLPLAEDMLLQILGDAPEEIQRDALYELGMTVLEMKDLPRTQQILAQFAHKYPSDPMTAEVLLRQGLLYRDMGAPSMAIAKFYAVMSTALTLTGGQMEHYQRVVLLAQTEIADTYYLQGKYAEAADFYRRVLKLNDSNLNEPLVRYKLIKSFDFLKQPDKMISEGLAFAEHFPDDPQLPEVRFLLASAFKSIGKRREALEQTMALLLAEKSKSVKAPEAWAYWQLRTGNDIGNQLYSEGDFISALQVYRNLSNLSASAVWQVPVWYQTALVLERLGQPEKALETYDQILGREKEIEPKDMTPNLKIVFEMSRWRKDQLAWESATVRTTREIAGGSVLASPVDVVHPAVAVKK